MDNTSEGREEKDDELRNHVRVGETIKENYRSLFKGMPKEEMLAELRTWKDDDLKWLCEQVALPTEDYEICQCAYEVIKEHEPKMA